MLRPASGKAGLADSVCAGRAPGVSGQPDLRTVRLPPDRKRLPAARQENVIAGRAGLAGGTRLLLGRLARPWLGGLVYARPAALLTPVAVHADVDELDPGVIRVCDEFARTHPTFLSDLHKKQRRRRAFLCMQHKNACVILGRFLAASPPPIARDYAPCVVARFKPMQAIAAGTQAHRAAPLLSPTRRASRPTAPTSPDVAGAAGSRLGRWTKMPFRFELR